MKLFLIYIRRYRLKYCHLKHAQQLGKWFNEKSLEPFNSWYQIYEIARLHPLTDSMSSSKGNVWIKIGLMLQELGVLPPRTSEYQHRFKGAIQQIDPSMHSPVNLFLQMLLKTGRSHSTCLDYLYAIQNFDHWFHQSLPYPVTLLQVNQNHCQDYLKSLAPIYVGHPEPLRKVRVCLNSFYRFLKNERIILINPVEKILLSRSLGKLTVCDEYQIRKIHSYIESPKSDPELAMLLCLILFYGWGREDLRFATVSTEDQSALSIIHHRSQRTKGRRYYNRPQKLPLPSLPAWFFNLQKRFYRGWLDHYQKTKRSYPNQPLILPPRGNHNRPISAKFVATLVTRATLEATGTAIPIRILRQTCGHIYASKKDTSLLTRLGWSPQFAFHYTWLPRTYFIPPTPTQNSSST